MLWRFELQRIVLNQKSLLCVCRAIFLGCSNLINLSMSVPIIIDLCCLYEARISLGGNMQHSIILLINVAFLSIIVVFFFFYFSSLEKYVSDSGNHIFSSEKIVQCFQCQSIEILFIWSCLIASNILQCTSQLRYTVCFTI